MKDVPAFRAAWEVARAGSAEVAKSSLSRQNAHAEILRRLIHRRGRRRGGTTRDRLCAGIAPRQRVEARVGLEAVTLSPHRGPGQCDDGVGKGDGLDQRLRQHRRSEEHTSELQSRFGISYAVLCL